MRISGKTILVIVMLISLAGCGNKTLKAVNNSVEDTVSTQISEVDTTKYNQTDNSQMQSFVISCGSGCAMNYSVESITQQDSVVKVVFKVAMSVNEQPADEYAETCLFYYTPSGKVDKIEREGENLLETLMPDARDYFLDFGNNLKKELKR